MDVRDQQKIIEQENAQLVYVYNPLDHDFEWRYDSKPYKIPSKEGKQFPKYLAHHLAKHLVNEYLADEKLPNEKIEQQARQLILPNG